MYKVEYADGKKSDLYTNLIKENSFAYLDEEVNHHVIMDEITDHWFDDASVKSQDAFANIYSGTKRRRQTTQGVSMCIK